MFELDLAVGQPLRADQNLPGDANEIGSRELRARPLVAIVIEDVAAGGGTVDIGSLSAFRLGLGGSYIF